MDKNQLVACSKDSPESGITELSVVTILFRSAFPLNMILKLFFIGKPALYKQHKYAAFNRS